MANVGTNGPSLFQKNLANATSIAADASGVFIAGSASTTTIDGDTGSATPTAGVITFDAHTNSGATAKFSAAASTVSLLVSDSSANTLIGSGSGGGAVAGSNNTGFGYLSCGGLTSGNTNCGVGKSALQVLRTGSQNTGIGMNALLTLDSGSSNTCVGYQSGQNYATSESSNITIGSNVGGTVGESHVIRIGTQGSGADQQNKCFVAGITGVSVSNLNVVTIDTTTGQLGSQASGGGSGFTSIAVQVFTSNGTYTPTASMKYCTIECWAGGGAGGGTATPTTNFNGGGGGGAGSYSRITVSAATIGASKTVTVGAGGTPGAAGNNPGGAGGDSSVGTICIAKGGGGGSGTSGTSNSSGGAGGVAGTGDIAGQGANGRGGFSTATLATITAIPGDGGSTSIGAGGNAAGAPDLDGGPAVGHGGGGGGSQSQTANHAGGAGGSGVVVITEFI